MREDGGVDDGGDDGDGDGDGEDSTYQPIPTCTNPYHPIPIILTLSNPFQHKIVSPSVPSSTCLTIIHG